MMHCIESYCPFEDQFPKGCPGKDRWLRQILYGSAAGIRFSPPLEALQTRPAARRRMPPPRRMFREFLRRSRGEARRTA